MNERKLASIQQITQLSEIPTAQFIELAKIQGWQAVVKKGEFKVGDKCVYFEVDSIIPRAPYSEFLVKKGHEDSPIRIKTIKLRGVLSQGVALPLGICGVEETAQIGEDVTELLNVTKYEPPCDGGDIRARGTRPGWIHKTDEPRVQSNEYLFEMLKGVEVYITQKLDGSSMSVAQHEVLGPFITSRNMSITITEPNRFTTVGNKYLPNIPPGYIVQGELVGPAIQKNRMGLEQHEWYVFNVLTTTGVRFGYEDMRAFCDEHSLPMVPLLYKGVMPFTTVDQLLKYADEGTYKNGHIQEGIVMRPLVPLYHPKSGFVSLKAISNEFLLKTGA